MQGLTERGDGGGADTGREIRDKEIYIQRGSLVTKPEETGDEGMTGSFMNRASF